jgi:hypothetical protein
MKRCFPLVLLLILSTYSIAQLKSQTDAPNISESITSQPVYTFMGLLDPARFSMHHQFSASYMTVGGQGIMLNSYLNTINYKISDPLYLTLNLGIANSPFNSFNKNPTSIKNNTQFFGGAELRYQPSKNSHISVSVNVAPNYNYYYGYPSPYMRLNETPK